MRHAVVCHMRKLLPHGAHATSVCVGSYISVLLIPLESGQGTSFIFSKVNADLVFSYFSFQEFKNTLSR